MRQMHGLAKGVGMGISLAGAAFGLAGGNGGQQSQQPTTPKQRIALVQSFPNDVYVFPAENFPQTLSDWRGANPQKEIVSVTQGKDAKHGISTWRNMRADTSPFATWIGREPATLHSRRFY